MIGDHKQLKPKPYSYELSAEYNFNASMLLINNEFEYISLKCQRRMKPLFADFERCFYGETEYIDK